ncbi:MAG: zinc ribbon domain-containing protein [Phycisphaerae bacterium]|nr:zinc ribbon domain-containing protein [Phycisphaerae bacterium]
MKAWLRAASLAVAALATQGMAFAGAYAYKTLTSQPATGEETSEKRYFHCLETGCGADFDMTTGQMVAALKGNTEGSVPCPKCGKALTQERYMCDGCNTTYEPVGHGGRPDKCPHCGKSLIVARPKR